jgi:hypothetical protein
VDPTDQSAPYRELGIHYEPNTFISFCSVIRDSPDTFWQLRPRKWRFVSNQGYIAVDTPARGSEALFGPYLARYIGRG